MNTRRVVLAESDSVLRGVLSALVRADPALELVATVADFVSASADVQRLRPDVLVLDSRLLLLNVGSLQQMQAMLQPTRLLMLTAEEDEWLALRRSGTPVVMKERACDLLDALRVAGSTERYAVS